MRYALQCFTLRLPIDECHLGMQLYVAEMQQEKRLKAERKVQ